jgi:hypothetical protein
MKVRREIQLWIYSSGLPDVSCVRVRRLWPNPEYGWRTFGPEEWASALLRIRTWQSRKLDKEAAEEIPVPVRLQNPSREAAKCRRFRCSSGRIKRVKRKTRPTRRTNHQGKYTMLINRRAISLILS